MNTTTQQDEVVVGEPSFGGSNKPKRNWEHANWTIKPGQPNVYRVLPPFGSLSKTGKWAYYEAVIWGFKGTNGKQKPFRSILVKNKGVVQQNDPVVSWVEKHQAQRNKALEQLKAEGKSKEQIEKALEPLTEFLNQFRVEKFYSLNVKRPDGTFGKLKVKIAAKKALDALFKRLIDEEGVNPVSMSEGVWVDFRKTGEGLQTQYTCDVVYDVETQNGRKVKMLRPASLTQEDIEKMKTESFDLALSFRTLSYDEMERLVASSADPEIVDAVFGTPKTSVKDVPHVDEESDGDSDLEEMDAMSLVTGDSKDKKAPPAVRDFLNV
jgi:hypothetical protein